ncbi:MAG: hypothetical protein ACYC9Y_13635 [Candidatus Methylomirabilia bacterium]
MVRRVVVLTVVAACALAWCGCGAFGDGADRRVALPAALPADVPLPAGAVLRSARDLGSKGLNLVFETDEPVSTVAGQLRSRLESGGWTLLSEVVVESAVFSSYRKQSRSVALGISRTGGVTVVGLACRQPEPAGEGAPG